MAGIVRNGVWYSGVQTPATTSNLGLVKPDGHTISVDSNGLITGKSGEVANCNTARATVAKVVPLTGFSLSSGARVLVRFTDTSTTAPTEGNLTMNVNGTGAKNVVDAKSNKAQLTYTSHGWFCNNQLHEFVYDGTYWVWMTRDNNTTKGNGISTSVAKTGSGTSVTPTIAANTTMDNAIGTLLNNDIALSGFASGGTWYGTCPTAAGTQAKVVTTSTASFALTTGFRVYVKFTYTNTHATPTLNVDSKGAKSIKAYGTTTPTMWWVAGDVVEFVYDGTNFIMLPSTGMIQNALARTLIVESNN